MRSGNYRYSLKTKSRLILDFLLTLSQSKERHSDLIDILQESCFLETVPAPQECYKKLEELDQVLFQRHCLFLQYGALKKYLDALKTYKAWKEHQSLYSQCKAFNKANKNGDECVYSFAKKYDYDYITTYRKIVDAKQNKIAPVLPDKYPHLPTYVPFNALCESAIDLGYFAHYFSAKCLDGDPVTALNNFISDIQQDAPYHRGANDMKRKIFSYYPSISTLNEKIENLEFEILITEEEIAMLA